MNKFIEKIKRRNYYKFMETKCQSAKCKKKAKMIKTCKGRDLYVCECGDSFLMPQSLINVKLKK